MKTVILREPLEEQVRSALRARELDELRAALEEEHPADIADVLDRLDAEDREQVFDLLAPEQAADVLSETDVRSTRQLVEQLEPQEARSVFEHISLDDLVEILAEDRPRNQEALLEVLEPQEAREARRLLAYPARSAGRLMSEAFLRVESDMTAAAALQRVRDEGDKAETVTDLFMLDASGKLQGIVTLYQLVRAAPEQLIHEIAHTEVMQVEPETDQEEVAWLVSQYDLFVLPVVAGDGTMLGIITVDDVVDVLVEEGTEDVLRLGAVREGATDETYFATPIWRAIQRRIGWLLLLFATGTLTVNVLEFFEGILAEVVALSFFIPLLIGTGGNTGAQTVSTIVRSLALGEVRMRDIWRVLRRELGSGLLLGTLLGTVGLGMALVLGNPVSIGFVVALSIVAICTWSNVAGALVPLIARRFGLDPALVSAPLITTLVDATGLAIYLLIARAVLGA